MRDDNNPASRRTLLGASAVGLAGIVAGRAGPILAQAASTQPAPSLMNSIGMEFLLIPAGEFMMGASDNDSQALPFERPQHRVRISRPFYLARFEVTQAEWEAVIGSNPYDRARSNPFYNLPGMAKRITRSNHPATVSWNDAQEFIARLNEKEGANIYRLPSEAEWEYAARAGTVTVYSFGNDARQLDAHAWHGGDFQTGGTHPIGQKKPNPWGLYDMHGNAWEWVQDWFDPNFYANSPQDDPKGPPTGNKRVVRGGSWHITADSWRSSFRREYAPDYRGISIGFRIVRNLEPAQGP